MFFAQFYGDVFWIFYLHIININIKNKKTLERRFRAQSGMSPHQYQLEYKLSRAIDIIRFYPEITLTEAALMLGFYDSAHFSKVFKRKYGVSPNDYTK